MAIRCLKARIESSASKELSSFCPTRIICSSLRSGVSILDRSRTSSIRSADSKCASSITITDVLPSACARKSRDLNSASRNALLGGMSDWPKSISTDSSNSERVSEGFTMTLNWAQVFGIDSKSFRTKVVLPVPASPVITMKPLYSVIANRSAASASRCLLVKKRKRGSGESEKGCFSRPKCWRYILAFCSRRNNSDNGNATEDNRTRGEFPFTEKPLFSEFQAEGEQESNGQCNDAANANQDGAFGLDRLFRNSGRIADGEAFGFLRSFHVRRHAGS